jgi:hypothetical protein
MARIGGSGLAGLLPRFPLEMTVAALATFLGTALVFDLPHRWNPADVPTPSEKVSLQAEPLPIRMFRPSEEHETSSFMEAVALSHLAPLRPQGEVDRAATTPPPAVQVLARSPSHGDKPKPAVMAAVPQPAPRPAALTATPSASASPSGQPQLASAPAIGPPGTAEPRPPAQIPPARSVSHSRFEVPVVGDLARTARSTVSDGLDSLGRGVRSLVGWP